ncbi:hypothetical protein C8J56DRAFT_957828 [Mycena floridula]|nr:hypothetical protein C8J56DRAFT_957828 [Mycena floridula]
MPETRLVVQVMPNGIPVDKRPDSYAAVLNINRAIQERAGQSGSRPEIVTVKWNTKGNAILSVKEGQCAADLVEYGEPISQLLTEKCPTGTTTNIQPDQKWIKLIAHGIRTHTLPFPGESPRLFTSEEIHQHLSEQNPSYAALNIDKRPTWIRSEAETMDIPFSSVVFAFADTNENREARSRLRRMAAFGREVTVTSYADLPPAKRCDNCNEYDHVSSKCSNPPNCRTCNGNHHSRDHVDACAECKEKSKDMEIDKCVHASPIQCHNCARKAGRDANHTADSRSCPERLARYRVANRANDPGRPPRKDEDGFMKAKTKGKKKGPSPSPGTDTVTITVSQNQYQVLAEALGNNAPQAVTA